MRIKVPSLKGLTVYSVIILFFLMLGFQRMNASADDTPRELAQSPDWEQTIVPLGPGFELSRLYPPSGWLRATGVICTQSGNDLLYTRTRTPPNTDDLDWARWRPTIPTIGLYDVYVYIPNYTGGSAPPSTQARYKVNHANGQTVIIVNQTQNTCSWVYLGRYTFNQGTTGNVYLGDYTGDDPYKLIAADAVKFVQVVTTFSGNPSSRLFFDNNGDRINLEVCANNLPGQSVRVQLSHPGQTYNVISQQATSRCVVFWDMDGPGPVLLNTDYTSRAALNQNPNPSWPVPCYTATGGQGLCDTKNLPGTPPISGYKLPYPGGQRYRLNRIDHDPYHAGIQNPAFDFGLPLNSIVVAARPGRVISVVEGNTLYGCSRNYNNYANFVAIRHSDNQVSYYVHLRQYGATVHVGDMVQRGQTVGYTGRSGNWCGAHLHFAVLNHSGGQRILIPFEDTGGVVPTVGQYYTSGNYLGSFTVPMGQNLQPEGNPLPEGLVQFRLTLSPSSNEVKFLAYDSLQDVTEMRVASSEAGLPGATWIPYTDTLLWSDSSIFVQYRTPDGRTSLVYSDTIASTANDPITTSFELESAQVCVGEDVSILNYTIPYCPQCSWEWNLGNGTTTQSFDPSSDLDKAWWEETGVYGLNLSYDAPGVYTINTTATNAGYTSSNSRQVTVVETISADFTIVRTGNMVVVTAVTNNATSWEWDFGDGATATGQTAIHTYANLDIPRLITLTTHSISGCTGETSQFVQNYHIFVPFLKR